MNLTEDDIARLIQALEFYANNFVDGGSKARMALEKFKSRTALMDDQGDGK